ncbi:MAG TPA: hemin uptake protein HemP [Ramlibacter sp.]|uniref:hemin uptake protein HemP n=1 Tax=Ramlibacter sp. TaxID=1917967 RepID=UPI002D547348|nr:hemin uptake protein HemP [Ramlibacter sp.]HZY19378.1 hemin uptake protein HemP [Ramlibacter sp.]
MTSDGASQRQPQPAASRPAPRSEPGRPPVDSATLLQGGRCVEIRHNGEVYRLQATRLGKLILTK